MKVINKRPEYIKSSDRETNMNQAYAKIFRIINKLETDPAASDKIIQNHSREH